MNEATYRKHAIYSQSACNVAGVLNSVTERAATIENPAGDPVLRLFLEQVNFLTGLARLDAVVFDEIKSLGLDLAGLIAGLTKRRTMLLASPDWKSIGSAIFETDLVIRALTVLAIEAFTVDYDEAYRRCDQYTEPVAV